MPAPVPDSRGATKAVEASLGLLALFVLWCFLSFSGLVQPFFLATPTEVGSVFVRLVFEKRYWSDVSMSIARISAGFLLSALVAVPLGAVLVTSRRMARLLMPPISFVRYLPVPALVPFLILWFGVGESEKIAVVFVGVFFQLIFIVVDDFRALPAELEDIARSLGASEWRITTTARFRHALPSLYDAGRVTLAWAWGWVMLAEVVGSDGGLGYMIVKAQRFLLNAEMIVGLLSVGLLGLIADMTLSYARPLLFRWAR